MAMAKQLTNSKDKQKALRQYWEDESEEENEEN